ncbi:MAG: hydroxyquinol 1,2-dioxygenase [Proteobacteria bacterium]|nr:hydroxyquinol 1,2-dioxygenase [Pseudomonadota bacterium]
MSAQTIFGSLGDYAKGGVEITGKDEPSRYLFSNMFEVAAKAKPWERIVVAKNLEFTIEVARAEGNSPWYSCAHDETALLMEGAMEIHFIQPVDANVMPRNDSEGAIRLHGEPKGAKMGHVIATQGHLTLLPAGSAYQFRPRLLGVVLIQSALGEESVEKWADIVQR